MKKLLAVLLAFSLSLSLAACGAPAVSSSSQPVSDPASSPSSEPAAPGLTVLKVGASPAPHAQILASVKDALAAEGIDLQVQEFTDYILPNTALEDGDLDANFFQHKPYLDDFNANNGTHLASAAAIHFEPLGLYGGKSHDLAAVADGATIAVPNDTTNEARALLLLESLGLIKVKEGAGLAATVKDIVENPKNLTIDELEAAQLPRALPDYDFAVINGNYALDAGVTDQVLTTENAESEAAQTFANIVAVREGDESRPEIKALLAALTSEETRAFITETYGVTVIPVF
ncbi:MAG: MetQ/NlpA family ABC transporter substrate-binding protein [Oscillospiraceae bacterium]|nr:MetQ/NlpA family ABC transporter substrate-binding protein [Oscillospiraceae bacterium]